METVIQPLSQDLIAEILLRLPLKSLVRSKAVCKFWRSLVSDPDFARSHFELATPRLLFNVGLGIQTLDFVGSLHSNPVSERLSFDFLPTRSYFDIQIVGSCRGFLLLKLFELNELSLYLWNPSTRVHKPIPSSPFHTSIIPCLYGFGYDSSKDDYLVVIVTRASPNHIAHVQFFSLRANMWNYIEGANLPPSNFSRTRAAGLLFNGAIHWLAYDDKLMDVVIAFDLTEKTLLVIPGPGDLGYDRPYCELWVHGRFLSLSVRRGYIIEIWVMEKYKVHSSWNKTLVLSLCDFSPICSTESGDIVMNDGMELVRYTDKGEMLERRGYQGYLEFQVPVYTESIFSLPGVSEQS